MNYTLTFKISPTLSDKYNANLPSSMNIKGGLLFLKLDRENDESGEKFKDRADRLVLREVQRINVFDGMIVRSIQIIRRDPEFSHGFIGQPGTEVFFRTRENPEIAEQQDWNSNPSIELKLQLWEKVCSEANIRLIYVYLYLIWELSNKPQWDHDINESSPEPLEEIPLLRNLLFHANKPNERVVAYLNIHAINSERSIENTEIHLNLAVQRLHIVKSAMYKRILVDVGYLD